MPLGIVPALTTALLASPLPAPVKALISHPAGIMTIFFWAPTFKWAITFSNLSQMKRPAELIPTSRQLAIFGTGFLWVRYSTQINPVNYNLLIVNFFMSLTAAYQLYRKM